MKAGSKRYRADAAKTDPKRRYGVEEAAEALKKLASTKFDATVTIAVRLNIDPKKSDQGVRGSVALPRGIGKQKKVAVFADGSDAALARDAGASEIGLEDLAAKIQGGWDDFDVAIAVQRAMKVVSRLGKVLGPKGKMPNPKNGTVVPDGKPEELKAAVREFAAGRIEFRNDAQGNIHAPVGKLSFEPKHLSENVLAFVDHLKGMRPASVKGHFLLNVSVAPAMGPGLTLDIAPQ